MIRNAVRALRATVVLAILTGLLYPLAMTGIGQVAFHDKAEGSFIVVDGKRVGSALIGQQWKGPQWFYGRPSAIAYDASTSGGSNLGPTSQKLADQIRQRAQAILAIEGRYVPGLTVAKIPVDLLLASASGLDPHISPAAAMFQAPRIAAVRNLPIGEIRALIRRLTDRAPLDLFSGPHVNVLELNVELEKMRS
jgi:K+-transporting ATPase ATPase C chain